jgi:hypothetical protein
MRLHCIYLSIIAALVVALLLTWRRPEPKPTEPTMVYIYDTIPITPPPIVPKPGRVEYVTVPAHVDTAAVIRAYFARHYGEDTLIDSRDFFLSLRWEVQENRPTLFQPTVINRTPTTIITHSPPRRMDIYAGAVMHGNTKTFGFVPSVTLRWDNAAYSVGYDIMRKSIHGGIYWRIR